MTDGDVIVDLCKGHHVQYGVVLHRGAGTDANGTVVTAQDGAEPNTRLLADLNVSDEHCGGRHERGWVNFGGFATVRNDHWSK
jgi:hypothetical protein